MATPGEKCDESGQQGQRVGHPSRQKSSVRQRSCRCTRPSGRRSWSTTMSDVIPPALHPVQGLHGQRAGADCDRVRRHQIACPPSGQARRAGEMTSEVAVGDDARDAPGGVDDARHAEAAGADGVHYGFGGLGRRYGGQIRPGVHEPVDAQQPLSQLSARMQVGKVLLAESLADEKRHRQGVAERQRGGGAGRRSQVERTGLAAHAAVEGRVGGFSQRAGGCAGQGDQAGAQPADGLDQPQDLGRLAALRQADHHVARLDGAEVAMDGLRGMDEVGRRAGARERRRQLPGDDARLAHAGGDHSALTLEQQAEGGIEPVVQAVGERLDRLGLDAQHATGQIEGGAARILRPDRDRSRTGSHLRWPPPRR